MEPLTRVEDQDGKDVRVPAGAESWESNEDGSVWTFHLRDNKWADGQDVTAEDYAYGIRQALDPNSGSLNGYLITCIKNGAAVNSGEMDASELGVKVIDDKTLEITLENPTPYFISLTDTRAMLPLRQDIVEQYGDTYGAEAKQTGKIVVKFQRRGKPTNSALLESHYQSEHLQDIGMSRPICCYTSK